MVTIILPISRKHFLKELFECLNALECDHNDTNLLVYVDGDVSLFQKVRTLVDATKFKERLCLYRRKGLPSVSGVHRRRKRIADIHNELKSVLVTCDYVFLLEDDTFFPADTLKRLMERHQNARMIYANRVGFITGVQLGRWGYAHIGAWIVDNALQPTQITSVPKRAEADLQGIDAAGIYCCLMTKEVYVSGLFEPYEKIMGPDFTFGLDLTRRGYKNFIDYSIECGHMTLKGMITPQNSDIIQVRFDIMKSEEIGWKLHQL